MGSIITYIYSYVIYFFSYFYRSPKKENENLSHLFQYEKYKNKYYINSSLSSIKSSPKNVIIKEKGEIFLKYTQIDNIAKTTNSRIIQVSDKKTRMVKVIKSIQIKNNEQNFLDAINEIKALKNLNHPNIIKVYEYFIEEKKSVDIVIEYLNGDNLFNSIKKNQNISEENTLIIMYQLFSCIKLSHEYGIIHRDLKPENIIITDNQNLLIKLIDFGNCEIFSNNFTETNRRIGTPSYLSPEIIDGENYSYETDIWSLGIIMYFMLSGKLPFEGKSQIDIFNSIKNKFLNFNDRVWKYVSEDAKNLIKCMLIKNKNKRININQIMKSDWVKKGIEKYDVKKILHDSDFTNEIIIKNILKFSKNKINQLQLFCLFYCVHNYIDFLKHNELKQIIKEFIYYDKDLDGKLSINEFENLLSDNGIDDEQIKEISQKIFNIFGSDFIFYESFIIICLSNKNKFFVNSQGIQRVWLFLNRNKEFDDLIYNNYLTVNDIKNIFKDDIDENLRQYNDDLWRKLFEDISISEKEPITYEKFKNLLQGMIL